MRLATLRVGQEQIAALVLANGALPISKINQLHKTRWETDLFALLKTGQLQDLRSWFIGLSDARETLFASATAFEQIVYGPLYRHPGKIWGIGLNYVEHASDLKEVSPSEEPASFMKPDTTIIGP
jgi:2-keto-4-pentenoate hydratase/2-oxohepta-3-ene-1,7-dioic acid hydratase in catechol pathway